MRDIYSIEDLRQLIFSLKEATRYQKPVAVKIAAVHNAAAIASGMARAGAEVIVVDGFRGGTGAAPKRIRDNVGVPVELALASIDQRLRDEGIRSTVRVVAGRGTIRCGRRGARHRARRRRGLVRQCTAYRAGLPPMRRLHARKVQLGHRDAAPGAGVERLDPEEGAERVVNLVRAWTHEIQGDDGRYGHQRGR